MRWVRSANGILATPPFLNPNENTHIVPGKFSMVYMSDGTSKLRYNAFQRRTESMAKRNQKILLHEKKKNDIHQAEATPKKQDQYQTPILLSSGLASKNEMETVCVRTKERRQVSR